MICVPITDLSRWITRVSDTRLPIFPDNDNFTEIEKMAGLSYISSAEDHYEMALTHVGEFLSNIAKELMDPNKRRLSEIAHSCSVMAKELVSHD
jgi:hypothetical protein